MGKQREKAKSKPLHDLPPHATEGEDGLLYLDPDKIRFQHSRVKSHFSGCGRSVLGTLDDIRQGTTEVADLPPIQIIIGDVNEEGGVWYYSLNNRRLWVIKQLKKEGLVERVGTRARRFRGKEPRRYCIEKCVLEANLMGGKYITRAGGVGGGVKGSSGDERKEGGDGASEGKSEGGEGGVDGGKVEVGGIQDDDNANDDDDDGDIFTERKVAVSGEIDDIGGVEGGIDSDDSGDSGGAPVNGFAAFDFDDSSDEETEEERQKKIEKAKRQAAKRRRQKEEKRRRKAEQKAEEGVDESGSKK
ncbi:hypothetical protein TrRE_jg776 [Triparma retinervis]|uniref:Uncharacterized protein n=1 Tax=Triparma retinervis TaxID=2557542 RepID=A0A9W6ZGM0_9STRA|nr:hypothetical protein TrRE_jg776 [Triparma retinervis]